MNWGSLFSLKFHTYILNDFIFGKEVELHFNQKCNHRACIKAFNFIIKIWCALSKIYVTAFNSINIRGRFFNRIDIWAKKIAKWWINSKTFSSHFTLVWTKLCLLWTNLINFKRVDSNLVDEKKKSKKEKITEGNISCDFFLCWPSVNVEWVLKIGFFFLLLYFASIWWNQINRIKHTYTQHIFSIEKKSKKKNIIIKPGVELNPIDPIRERFSSHIS